MNFGQSITTCMGKYFTFSGRAKRSEYWWFYLFTVLMSWGASLVGSASFGPSDLGGDLFSSMVSLVFLFPWLAAGSRRLHDIGRSGWWQLLILTIIGVILLIVWWASDTKPQGDKYDDPRGTQFPDI
ncbi:MAG: DUF805 domain-containing protein [Alphaproteobacteria bacterium]|nr:DUF805 domain-containing protein [Alphaproteobacteria bacterium]